MTDSNPVIDAFTEMSSHYEQTVDWEIRQLWRISYREFIRRFVLHMQLTGNEAVLDVATGTAMIPRVLLELSEWQGRVIGLDITLAMLAQAQVQLKAPSLHPGADTPDRAIAERVTLVGGSGLALPFADQVFDIAVCALGTHHMQPHRLLPELRRVVRPGGRMVLADVVRTDFWRTRPGRIALRAMIAWYGRTQGESRMRAEVEALQNLLSPEEWRELVLKAGFVEPQLTIMPASRRWFPSGLLLQAHVT